MGRKIRPNETTNVQNFVTPWTTFADGGSKRGSRLPFDAELVQSVPQGS